MKSVGFSRYFCQRVWIRSGPNISVASLASRRTGSMGTYSWWKGSVLILNLRMPISSRNFKRSVIIFSSVAHKAFVSIRSTGVRFCFFASVSISQSLCQKRNGSPPVMCILAESPARILSDCHADIAVSTGIKPSWDGEQL